MGLVLLNGVIISVLHWGLQKWVLPKAQRAAGKGAPALCCARDGLWYNDERCCCCINACAQDAVRAA